MRIHPHNTIDCDLLASIKPTLLDRAKKREVQETSDSTWIVTGVPSMGDSFDMYHVSREDGQYSCSCQEHNHGTARSQCSHKVAVMIYESGPKWIGATSEQVQCWETAAIIDQPAEKLRWDHSWHRDNLLFPEDFRNEVIHAEKVGEGKEEKIASDSIAEETPEEATRAVHPTFMGIQGGLDPLNVGELASLAPSWSKGVLRDGQIYALEQIRSAYLSGKRNFLVEAPPGMGKTLMAYLAAKMLRCRANYICTTKALQQQALRDFPDSELLMGRANYPTADYSDEFPHTSCGDCNFNQKLGCKYCIPEEGHEGEILGWTSKRRCPYYKQKLKTQKAPLAILNTAYAMTVFGNYMAAGKDNVPEFLGYEPGENREKDTSYGFANRGMSIFDEADELESAVMSHIEVVISERVLRFFKIEHPGKGSRWNKRIEFLTELSSRISTHLESHVEVNQSKGTISHNEENSIDDLDGGGDAREKFDKQLSQLREKILMLLSDMQEIPSDERKEAWVYQYEENQCSFKPVRVNRFASELLFSHSKLNIIMSGTIVSPTHFAADLGLNWDETEFISLGSVFPVERRPVLYIPAGNMSFKTKAQDTHKIIHKIRRIHETFLGRTLVHTVSYDLSRSIYMSLNRDFDCFVYYSAREKDEAVRRFQSCEGGILIAASMERGWDGKHDLCRKNVIAKVPFPNLKDMQVSRRMFQPTPREGEFWYKLQTIRTIIQMYGRSTRSLDDWSRTFILDENFKRLWGEVKAYVSEYFSKALRMDSFDPIERSVVIL